MPSLRMTATLYRRSAAALYGEVVVAARARPFYDELQVCDSFAGRFEMVVLHVFLLFFRLKGEEEDGQALSQFLMDTVIADMDENVRQAGVGDLSVGRHVKKMAGALLGRIAAYDAVMGKLDAKVPVDDDDDAVALGAVLRRYLYAGEAVGDDVLRRVILYICRQKARLAEQSFDALLAGRCVFDVAP